MNIIDRIFRKQLEKRNGKIHTFPGNWVFGATPAQIARTLARNKNALMEREDADGRKMFLIHQRGVHCPNADLCAKKYPRSNEGKHWWLPLYMCRKCEHHRKGKRRGTPRYPCCRYEATENPEAQAVGDTLSLIDAATKKADEILNRR